MSWNEKLSKDKRKALFDACRGMTSEYLIAAFTDYCIMNHMVPTITAMDVVSRDRLVDLVYKMIFVTRICDAAETVFWISSSGRFYVDLHG